MRSFFVASYSLFAAGLIHTAVGLNCDSMCAACWKDDSPGEDIKIGCVDTNGYCGVKCPQGYHDMHCATASRCEYVNHIIRKVVATF